MSPFSTAPFDVPWVVWAIALPLALASVGFVRRQDVRLLAVIGSCAVAACVAGLTWQVVAQGPQRYRVGGWGAPLGIELYADGLSTAMLLVTAVIGVSVSIYAVGYFGARARSDTAAATPVDFWTLWLFLWAALNALFLSGDLFNVYVTLELVTLSAVGLVATAGGSAATAAALHYLLAALLGSLLYLLGTALLYASYGTLDLVLLSQAVSPGGLPAAAIAALTVGLAVKSALFPFHFWLPPAHANAQAPVSAVLSALVVTAGFYLMLRLWFDVFPAAVPVAAGRVLAMLGASAIVWGSLQALRAARLKSLVAYSTVAQLGYLFLVFGLAAPGETTSPAWSGGVLFALSHACAKASMFMAAGIVLHVAHHDRIADLHAMGRHLPVTFFTMALAGVTLMGLPPSGAFVAKWMLLDAALSGGHWVLAAVIVGGGVLAAGYLFRVLGQAFTPSDEEAVGRVPRTMEWTALGLAVLALSLGPAAAPVFTLLAAGSPR